jgi:hypothetical protein
MSALGFDMNDNNSSEKRQPLDQQELEHLIRERAHQLWEAAGSPAERSMEFWLRARELVEAETRASHAPEQPGEENT